MHLSHQEGPGSVVSSSLWSPGAQRLPLPPLGFPSHFFSLRWVPALGRGRPLRSSACLYQGRRPKGQGEGHRSCVFLLRAGSCHQSASKCLVSHWPRLRHMLFPEPLPWEEWDCRECSQVATPSGRGASAPVRWPRGRAGADRGSLGSGERGPQSCLEV